MPGDVSSGMHRGKIGAVTASPGVRRDWPAVTGSHLSAEVPCGKRAHWRETGASADRSTDARRGAILPPRRPARFLGGNLCTGEDGRRTAARVSDDQSVVVWLGMVSRFGYSSGPPGLRLMQARYDPCSQATCSLRCPNVARVELVHRRGWSGCPHNRPAATIPGRARSPRPARPRCGPGWADLHWRGGRWPSGTTWTAVARVLSALGDPSTWTRSGVPPVRMDGCPVRPVGGQTGHDLSVQNAPARLLAGIPKMSTWSRLGGPGGGPDRPSRVLPALGARCEAMAASVRTSEAVLSRPSSRRWRSARPVGGPDRRQAQDVPALDALDTGAMAASGSRVPEPGRPQRGPGRGSGAAAARRE